MDNFTYCSPTYFAFGRGQERTTGTLVTRFGGKKILLHYGGGSILKNGVYDLVTASLKEAGVNYLELGGVHPNPRSGLVYEGIELCRKEGVDFILAVGGGSVIDSAKAIAIGVPYDGDFWDFFSGKAQLEKALPVGVVLTIPAAGSEGSPNSVITHEPEMLKWGAPKNDVVRPRFAVMNPEFTFSLPPYQTACGITDMMAHICERYFTTTSEVEVTDNICEGLLKAIIKAAPRVIEDPRDYAARADIMWCGMLAHNNLCGVGRIQDWSSHQIEHELTSVSDCAHGAGLAVVMPNWMEYVMKSDISRFQRFAENVWDCPYNADHPEKTAAEGVSRFRIFLNSIGMPSSLSELGISENDIGPMVEHRSLKGFPFGAFRSIGPGEMTDILHLANK